MSLAVCMVGHVCDWMTNPACESSFLEHVAIHNPDIYIDTYDDCSSRPRKVNPLDERPEVHKHTDEELQTMFGNLNNVQLLNREIVDLNWRTARLQEANQYLRGDDIANNFEVYCLVRKIYNCYQAVKNSGKQYDVIMITSPSVIYTAPLDINIEDGWFYNAAVGYPMPEDIIVMGTPAVMDIFVKRFEVLNIMYSVHTHMGACAMDRTLLFRYVACLHNMDGKWRSTIRAQFLGH